jgi:acetyl-CoA acetyltransferase
MATPSIRDKTAIVGVGWTEFSRNSGTSTMNLAVDAGLKAIADAGLRPHDIDGVISWFHRQADSISARELAQAMDLECRYELFADEGGHWMCAAIMTAASVIHAGWCKNVLVFKARNTYSEGRAAGHHDNRAAGTDQFRLPFGLQAAASSLAFPAVAHMARYGTTTLDFAHLAVRQRQHAQLNTKAMMRKPMTIEDHQNSRWISYPYRLLDCCQQSDGAVAVVVSSAERARDLRQAPIYILAGSTGESRTTGIWETSGANLSPALYEEAGISSRDVSLAEMYDPFTGMCLLHIEDFGLAPKGESGRWVTEGRNGLDGETPVNTHGGLLSEAHINGLNHVLEAVQQLRPGGVVDDLCQGPHSYDRTVCRQVRNPEIALVCGEGGGSSLLLRR